ncbi:MAG: hypothetical protein Q8N81_07125 [bacterium]|nr:hypothetical protein [bacterium]
MLSKIKSWRPSWGTLILSCLVVGVIGLFLPNLFDDVALWLRVHILYPAGVSETGYYGTCLLFLIASMLAGCIWLAAHDTSDRWDDW